MQEVFSLYVTCRANLLSFIPSTALYLQTSFNAISSTLFQLSTELEKRKCLYEWSCDILEIKGIVGGFEFTVQRNLKEEHERPWTYVCERQRKATKVGSTASVRNSVLIISHVTFRDCRVYIFPTTFL